MFYQWVNGSSVGPLRIVADENIPGLDHYFVEGLCLARTLASTCSPNAKTPVEAVEIIRRPGSGISKADLEEAHMLLVRSVTPVTPDLIAQSKLEFVGSCTIGTDHLAVSELTTRGIQWAHAPGCNANSVAEYVLEQVMHFCANQERAVNELRVGLLGCGNVGRRVAEKLQLFGCQLVVCDPPLQERMTLQNVGDNDTRSNDPNPVILPNGLDSSHFGTMTDVFGCDVVTVHVPLVREGAWPTYHLITPEQLKLMPAHSLFLNTARGAVVDLKACMAWRAALPNCDAQNRYWVFDVFEGEPNIDPQHVSMLHHVTPHIAGHSQLGKEWGTRQIWQSVLAGMGLPIPEDYPYSKPLAECTYSLSSRVLMPSDWAALLSQISELPETDQAFRQIFSEKKGSHVGQRFEALRKAYRPRKEFQQITVKAPYLNIQDVFRLRELGVRVEQ